MIDIIRNAAAIKAAAASCAYRRNPPHRRLFKSARYQIRLIRSQGPLTPALIVSRMMTLEKSIMAYCASSPLGRLIRCRFAS
jgi:hypothetical protein